MKRFATLLGAALLLAGTPALAGGYGVYDFGDMIRYVGHDDWSVSIRIGDGGRHHDRRDDYRRYRPAPPRHWIPPGQWRKHQRQRADYGRGFRQGYREGFRDGYDAAPCYEERRDGWGRRVRVERPGWRCR